MTRNPWPVASLASSNSQRSSTTCTLSLPHGTVTGSPMIRPSPRIAATTISEFAPMYGSTHTPRLNRSPGLPVRKGIAFVTKPEGCQRQTFKGTGEVMRESRQTLQSRNPSFRLVSFRTKCEAHHQMASRVLLPSLEGEFPNRPEAGTGSASGVWLC